MNGPISKGVSSTFARAFSGQSAILKIVEELALGTRLEQMTQNRAIRNPRINESAKSRVSDMYVVVVSCFHSILHLKTWTKGTYALRLRLLLFVKNAENVALQIHERNVSSAFFRWIYTVNEWENALVDMFWCFWVSFRQKNGFCVLIDVHEMAKIRKFLSKQYVSTEKIVLKHFMAFLQTLVIALTISVRLMSICCCSEQMFAIN